MQKKTIATILLLATTFLGNAFAGTSENDFSKKTNKCSSLWSAKKHIEANICYEELIQSYPDKATGYIGVATYLIIDEKDPAKALEYLRLAESKEMSSPDKCNISGPTGVALYQSTQYSDAKEAFQKTLTLIGQCSNIKKTKELYEAYVRKTDEMARVKSNQEYERIKEASNRVLLGQSKTSVLNVMGANPRERKAISTKQGIFECWEWNWFVAVLFLNGRVAEMGLSSCPIDIFH